MGGAQIPEPRISLGMRLRLGEGRSGGGVVSWVEISWEQDNRE